MSYILKNLKKKKLSEELPSQTITPYLLGLKKLI